MKDLRPQLELYRQAYQQTRQLEELLHKLRPYHDDHRLYNYAVLITAKLWSCQAELTYKQQLDMAADEDDKD